MVKKKQNGFIMQAGVLAIAGIIVRMIGLLYRSPLTMIIGDEGNGYYSTAYMIYTIILLVSSYSIPSAISKVIAARLAVGEYKNAQKIFRCSFVYVIIVGGMGSLCCYFFADFLVGSHSATVLRVFAPTIFLSGILGVLRGYFQAHRTMIQTSISQILEQVLNAIVSIGGAIILMKLVADQDATTKAIYGAMGSAVGTGAGVAAALLFMTIAYWKKGKKYGSEMNLDSSSVMKEDKVLQVEKILNNRQIFKIIFLMVTPVVLSTCIYNLSGAFNLKIYYGIYENLKGYTETQAATMYGLFSGKATQLANIPIALASAMSAAIIPTIASTYEVDNLKETNQKIAQAIKTTMMISIPAMVGLLVLAKPIVLLLYPQKSSVDLVAQLLQVLAITVIFYGLSTLSNGILQGTGKVNIPVVNAGISLIIQTVVLILLLVFTELNLFALAIAAIVYSFSMCMLNGIWTKKHLGYQQEYKKTFILPLIASVGMGVVAYGLYQGIAYMIYFIHDNRSVEMTGINNAICLFPTIIVAGIIYMLLLIRLGGFSKSEIERMPKGAKIAKILTKIHCF